MMTSNFKTYRYLIEQDNVRSFLIESDREAGLLKVTTINCPKKYHNKRVAREVLRIKSNHCSTTGTWNENVSLKTNAQTILLNNPPKNVTIQYPDRLLEYWLTIDLREIKRNLKEINKVFNDASIVHQEVNEKLFRIRNRP